MALIFETLVTLDDGGRTRPALAISWQAAPGNQRWQFRLRPGIRFHDGSALTAEIAAASLRASNPSWNVLADGDSVVIERDAPDGDVPAELGLWRNAIVKRNAGKLSGTGPFHIEDWQTGKKLTLRAEENYWRGRAFVDAVEIEMGKNFHDQLIALELGKADLVEVASEQAHRVAMEGRDVESSQPVELVALTFMREAQSPEEKLLREALALGVERASIRSVLLQGAGQPTAGILPNWMSGYAFVFPAEADLPRARHQRELAKIVPNWTIGYDSNDSIEGLLAERIALNAKDAGLNLLPTKSAAAVLQMVRIPLASTDPWIALGGVAAVAGVAMPKINGTSVEDLYHAEQTILASRRMIPLFHLPASYAVSPAVKDWAPGADASWHLADAWLGTEKP